MAPAEHAGFFSAVERTSLAEAMRGELWLYPIVEIFHIWGFIVLVGAVVMFDLRVLGVSRHISIRALGRHLLPWSAGALVVIVPTGLMMFSAHATEFVGNPVFLLKLTLIALALVNAAAFHAGIFRDAARWDVDATAPVTAKAHAIASICLWFGIVSCGRLLAYV
jgi:hypothetical protein